MTQVSLSNKLKKELRKIPKEVRIKLQQWVLFVESKGLITAKKFSGFRDHGLKGKRKGQRSVYLTKKWRVIYSIGRAGQIDIVIIEEVIPHDY